MAKVTPDQFAEKWVRNLGAATQDIARGVDQVTQAPGVAAARQKDVWIAKIQASQEKWARNVARVSVEEWRAKMKDVGIPRIASGAAANQGKMQQFAAEFLPHLDRGVAQVKAMPKRTLEDGVNRAIAMIRHNAGFKRGGNA